MTNATPTHTPDDLPQAELALQMLQSGQIDSARTSLEDLHARYPADPQVAHMLAAALAQLGELDRAETLLEQLAQQLPRNADVRIHLANVYRLKSRPDDAVRLYRAAIGLEPGNADAHYNLALVLKDVGDVAQSIKSLQRAVMFKPQHAQAYCALGQTMGDSDPEAAASYFRQALAVQPGMLEAQVGLVVALGQLGRFEEAERVLSRALRSQPNNVLLIKQRAFLAMLQGQLDEAVKVYESLLAEHPHSEDILQNLGSVYQMLGDNDRALSLIEAALVRGDKRDAKLLNALANIRVSQNDLAGAETLMREAASEAPQSAPYAASLGRVLLARGDVSEAITQYRKAVSLAPQMPELYSNLIYAMHFEPSATPAERFAAQRAWEARYAPVKAERPQAAPGDPSRKLRVGLVSGDFRDHPVSRGLLGMLSHYDKSRLEIFAYSTSFTDDEVTAEVRAQVDHWRPSASLPPAVLAGKITRDGIDVLIDLSGHTAGNRLVAFARRPALVQLTWLGFFTGTGLSAMDYRLTDEVMDPPGKTEAWHTEKLLHMPAPFCYQPIADAPEVNALPALKNGYLTFGALTQFARFNDQVLAAWEPIFKQLPQARLKVFSGAAESDTASVERFAKRLEGIGLSRDRFEIIPWLEYRDFLDRLREVDVALDPFPYPGGMTTMDALWMGVPTVTRAGPSSFERAGASLLRIAGLDALIAESPSNYTQIAIDLGEKRDWLAQTRASLRSTLAQTPLIDGKTFAVAFEALLRKAWQDRVNPQP